MSWGQESRHRGDCTQKPRMWGVEHRLGFSRDWTLGGRGAGGGGGLLLDTGDSRDQSLGRMVDSCLCRAGVGWGAGEKPGRGDAVEESQELAWQGSIASHRIQEQPGSLPCEKSVHTTWSCCSRGPEVWRKGSQMLRQLRGGAVGTGSRHTLASSNSAFVSPGYSTPTSSRSLETMPSRDCRTCSTCVWEGRVKDRVEGGSPGPGGLRAQWRLGVGWEGRALESPDCRMGQEPISPMPLSPCLTPCPHGRDVFAHCGSRFLAPVLGSGLRCQEISGAGSSTTLSGNN